MVYRHVMHMDDSLHMNECKWNNNKKEGKNNIHVHANTLNETKFGFFCIWVSDFGSVIK